MEVHKQQKASMEAEKAEQKRKVSVQFCKFACSKITLLKDLDMLQKYQPWGRPAGGAPRVSWLG